MNLDGRLSIRTCLLKVVEVVHRGLRTSRRFEGTLVDISGDVETFTVRNEKFLTNFPILRWDNGT